MKIMFFYIVAFCCLCISAAEPSTLIQKIEAFVQNDIEPELDAIHGGYIGIVVNGKVVYKRAFGCQDSKGTPVNDNTLFALASVSKAVVSIGLGQLIDKKVMSLDQTVNWGGRQSKMRMWNLLSHTTGYCFRGDAEIEAGWSYQKMRDFIRKKKPEHKTGVHYDYSNFLYSLIDDVLKEKNWDIPRLVGQLSVSVVPGGLTLLPTADQRNVACPYACDGSALSSPSKYQVQVPAAAGVFASLNAMIGLLKVCLGKTDVVSQDTLAKLHKPVVRCEDVFKWRIEFPFPKKRIQSWYGMGWRSFRLDNNEDSQLIFHGGYTEGTAAFLGVIPSRNAGIVIVTNQTSSFAARCGLKFWKMMVSS